MNLDRAGESQLSRRSFLVGAAATTAVAATFGLEGLAQAQQYQPDRSINSPSSLVLPRHLFGMAGHPWWMDLDLPQYLAIYKDLGVTDLRLAADWKRLEPIEGQYDFSLYDRVFPAVARAGIEISGT